MSDIKIFRFLEKPSATICIMQLTDLMLQKLQIALHKELFKYVSQVLCKNQMNFECEFSQLPLFYCYVTNAYKHMETRLGTILCKIRSGLDRFMVLGSP